MVINCIAVMVKKKFSSNAAFEYTCGLDARERERIERIDFNLI